MGKVRILVHRVIWLLHYKSWPSDEIDHIDGNRSNNKIQNLRVVAAIENAKNLRLSKLNTSGRTGVYSMNSRFAAAIGYRYKTIFLGVGTFEECVALRESAENKYGYHENHGKYRYDKDSR